MASQFSPGERNYVSLFDELEGNAPPEKPAGSVPLQTAGIPSR